MSKSKKPRKKYKPREIKDVVEWAISGAHLFPKSVVDKLMAHPENALIVLKRGNATADEWNIIAQALNTAEALAGLNIGNNLLPQIRSGQVAMKSVAERIINKGNSVMRGSELADIDEALTMYRAQLSLCTQAEFGRAIKKIMDWHKGRGSVENERLVSQMLAKQYAEEV